MNGILIFWLTGCGEKEQTDTSSEPPIVSEPTSEEPCEPQTWYRDADEDDFGDPYNSIEECEEPNGYVADNQDCNDQDADEFPGAIWYADSDGDGYGNPDISVSICARPMKYVKQADDCDDEDATRNPASFWYIDDDADGFGNPSAPIDSCTASEGASSNDQDCDDENAFVRPNVNEICDAIDNNCNGLIDDDDPDIDIFTQVPVYLDEDLDGYGTDYLQDACTSSNLGAIVSGDCDDSDPLVYPGRLERTDEIDQNCDGNSLYHYANDIQQGISLDMPTTKNIHYEDMTGDGLMDMVVYKTNGYSAVGPFMIFSGVETYENEPFEGEVLSWDGVGPGDYFAGQVVNLHDIDGDGLYEWLVSAWGEDTVYLLDSQTPSLDQAPMWISTQENNRFGTAVVSLGDIDGDGFIEAAASAPHHGTKKGAVYLLDESEMTDMENTPQTYISGGSNWAQFGTAMDNAGDIDGDGLDEIIVLSSGGNGRVRVLGAEEMFDSSFSLADTTSFTGWELGALAYGSVRGIGDFNGDGYRDFATIGYGIRISFGGSNLPLESSLGDSVLQYTGSAAYSTSASRVVDAGDLNGDGAAELVFGDSKADITGPYSNNGLALVFWGGTQEGVFGTNEDADIFIHGNGYFGAGMTVGDVDNDGINDLWIGKTYSDQIYFIPGWNFQQSSLFDTLIY